MGENLSEQSDLLQKTKDTWTKTDWILLLFGLLINIGDGIEIYLPGIYGNLSFEITVLKLRQY